MQTRRRMKYKQVKRHRYYSQVVDHTRLPFGGKRSSRGKKLEEQGYAVHVMSMALEWPRKPKKITPHESGCRILTTGGAKSRHVRFVVGSKAPESPTEAERKDD
ncbi:hypothetical protein VTN49DRAFT_4831 [Thermomyces lanuginosus]|uniref:uncharacterized protein n=1 Tax=Thermomyces lanuginosus TaxID=5541 RepID=UPI003742DB18